MADLTASDWRADNDNRRRIRTFTGKLVNPLAMRPDDIDILDIAHHLSLECRYTGACPDHYSVAQHSVLVSHRFADPKMSMAGLLHDAGEAYLKDVPSPVKRDPRMAWYVELEHELIRTIFTKFGVPVELLELTKPADDAVLVEEIASFWNGKDLVVAWEPRIAEAEFLWHYNHYKTARV